MKEKATKKLASKASAVFVAFVLAFTQIPTAAVASESLDAERAGDSLALVCESDSAFTADDADDGQLEQIEASGAVDDES